ncbi:MAG: HAMP domain-containing histidine kinase [Prolixibacteraceae bacterium]|jgi:signal transduction histidine kinase|nr:HAMP domain-containing histidine kinase [Prolixibacteraceae bacterium]
MMVIFSSDLLLVWLFVNLIGTILLGMFFFRLYRKKSMKEVECDGNLSLKLASIINHDIRTPISSMNSLLEFLEEEDLEEDERRNMIKQIRETSSNIEHLIHDMLNWIHLYEGKIVLNNERIDVVAELKSYTDVVASFKPMSSNIDIQFISDYPSLEMCLDVRMLRTVYRNIVMNSFRFLPTLGKIETRVTTQDNHCVLSVKDNGSGISETQMDVLTKLNRRVSFVDNLNQGVGLGLQISFYMVSLMGGEIKIKSSEGKGTTFYIYIPLIKD